MFDGVSFEIEADGVIGTVVDDDSHGSTERRKFTVPSHEFRRIGHEQVTWVGVES